MVYELLHGGSARSVELLRWKDGNYEIGPQFKEGEIVYTPGQVHPTLLAATRLPHGLTDYGDPTKFFWKVVALHRDYMRVSREQGVFLARFVFSTWFPDCGASPITVCITGMNMSQIMKLFRLLHTLCRRALLIAALNADLPFFLRPTLLVNVPTVSARVGDFWRATNYSGTFVPGPRGTMRNLACAKAVYCEKEAARTVWAPEALHIELLPTSQEFPSLSEFEEAQLAAEYLPQLLMFRLRILSSLYRSDASSSAPSFSGFPLGASLPACIAEDPEIREASTLLREAHELDLQAIRALDPNVIIVTVIWTPAHEEKEISTAEITGRVNALTRDRGGIGKYNVNEIGWKLKHLGLDRQNNGKRKTLRFNGEMRLRVHQVAARFGLQLPKVENCADCRGMQLIGQEEV